MAMQMRTTAPFRDDRISLAEGIAEEARDMLSVACAADRKAVTGWCDACTELRTRVEDTEPVLRRLYGASSDEEARAIVAGTPLAPAVTGGAVAA